ncbi:endoplasmic reticulum auxin efflux carrier [Pholiota molesta]|nr:endoplasmic reticulum auxin efflux carrier [Pholiota molesta]
MAVGIHSGDADTPFGDLLLAVFNSILEVFLLCAAGYILARQDILDKRTQKQINRLNVSLFTPALLFSKVAFYLTPEKLKELWVIPIWFTIVTLISMVIGRVLGWLFNLQQSQRSFIMAAAMFMNSNALPIALMQSLVVSVPDLAWGSDDNKDAMLGRALTYLTMYSTLGMVIRYSYGVRLLSRADTNLVPNIDVAEENTTEHTPLLGADAEICSTPPPHKLHAHGSVSTLAALSGSHKSVKSSPGSSLPNSGNSSPFLTGSPGPMLVHLPSLPPNPENVAAELQREVSSLRPSVARKNTTFYNSFPNSPNESRQELPTWDETSDVSGDEDGSAPGRQSQRRGDLEGGIDTTLSAHSRVHPNHANTLHHYLHAFFRYINRMWIAFVTFMTVPLWAAIASLFVACFEPVKHALEVHMAPLNESINVAGKCAVPLTLVVLGAYFYTPPVTGAHSGNGARKKTAKQTWILELAAKLRFWRRSSHRTESISSRKDGDRRRSKETTTVVLAVAARMLITPAVLLPLIIAATKSDWHAVFEDPIFVVVNVILLCSPPALTLAQITAAVSGDTFERLISRTIFWSYCIMTPPVTIGCVLLGLWLAKL